MFTGIIEATGILREVLPRQDNLTFRIASPLAPDLKPDQSLSHNGVCLTVEKVEQDHHWVSAVRETLDKTTLDQWVPGQKINLERSLLMNSRLDGHIVQGHVDTTGHCISTKDCQGSWEFEIEYPESFASLLIEKGSICLDGISLTAYNVRTNRFNVAIIPYTYEHTNLKELAPGMAVNLEFDVLGKYVNRLMAIKG